MLRIRLPCWGCCGRPGSGCWTRGCSRATQAHPLLCHSPVAIGPVGRVLLQGRQQGAAPRGASGEGCVCVPALGASWVPLCTPIPSWAGLHTPEPDRGCRVSRCSHWLPADRSPLAARAGHRGAGGGEGLGGGCLWCLGRAGTCRGELHLSVALGIPGRQLRVGRLTGVPFGCPCLWEGTSASPFFSCPLLPPSPS